MNYVYVACSFYDACNMRFHSMALALHVNEDIT